MIGGDNMTRDFSTALIDVDLKLRVELALNAWSKGQTSKIAERVFVFAKHNGEVTLRGRVYSRSAAEEAMQIAGTIPGVKLVFNQIAITRNCWPLVSTRKL